MKYLIALLCLPILYADTFHVNLDTSPVDGGIFTIGFYLIDGDATANNTATVSNAQFGGGNLLGAPSFTTSGASGSLASSMTLTDVEFFNAYFHDFQAGSTLSFDLAFTTNFAGGAPDSLAFVLIDTNTFLPVPTLDPLGTDVFLLFDLSNPGLGQTYGTDPTRTELSLGAPVVTTPTTAEVPEPNLFFLLLVTLGGIALSSRGYLIGRRWTPTKTD